MTVDDNTIINDLLLTVQKLVAGAATVLHSRLSNECLECRIYSTGSNPIISVQYRLDLTEDVGLFEIDSFQVSQNRLKNSEKISPVGNAHDSRMEESSYEGVIKEERPEVLFILPDEPEILDETSVEDWKDFRKQPVALMANNSNITVSTEEASLSGCMETKYLDMVNVPEHSQAGLMDQENKRKFITPRYRSPKKRTTVDKKPLTHPDRTFRNTKHVKKFREKIPRKPYICGECDKSFARLAFLKDHIRRHTNERPYVCNQCGKSFCGLDNLASHEITHSEDRPFSCAFCEKSFKRKKYLTEHLRTHTGERPFVCNWCGKGFTQSGALNRHRRRLHFC